MYFFIKKSNYCNPTVIWQTDMAKAFIGQPAPAFKATAVVDDEFKEVALSDYKGKYVVLFFYPLDLFAYWSIDLINWFDKFIRSIDLIGCSYWYDWLIDLISDLIDQFIRSIDMIE